MGSKSKSASGVSTLESPKPKLAPVRVLEMARSLSGASFTKSHISTNSYLGREPGTCMGGESYSMVLLIRLNIDTLG